MNKRKRLLVVVSALIIAFLVVILLVDRSHVGRQIDSFKGVDVYYNGIIYTSIYGKNFSDDGYYYGYKWQCVEFIKRFYYDVKKHRMPDVYGNAKDFFDPAVQQGNLNKARGLVQYRNGESVRPEVDDLMVFTDTRYGHVAIVTSVNADSVEVIQQNILWKTRESFKMTVVDNRYFVGEQRKPAGWLRKE